MRAVPCWSASWSIGSSDSPWQSSHLPNRRSSAPIPGPLKKGSSRLQPVSRIATRTDLAAEWPGRAASRWLTRSNLFNHEVLFVIYKSVLVLLYYRSLRVLSYVSLRGKQLGCC